MLSGQLRRALRPDAQAFDEVRIVTVPRYKESGLSGDEWRISAKIQFFRKGILCDERTIAHTVEDACAYAAYFHDDAISNGKAFFAGELDTCDQEGCAEKATVTLKIKQGYTRQGDKRELSSGGEYRRFCKKHRVRGDCGLEDADRNYEEIENPFEEIACKKKDN